MNTELLPMTLCNCAETNSGCCITRLASFSQSFKNCSTLSDVTLNLFIRIT